MEIRLFPTRHYLFKRRYFVQNVAWVFIFFLIFNLMLIPFSFNPNYASELCNEGQKCTKISGFMDFSIAVYPGNDEELMHNAGSSYNIQVPPSALWASQKAFGPVD